MKFDQIDSRIFEQIFRESHSFMTILSVPEFRFLHANPQHARLIRKNGYVGKMLTEVEPELEAQGFVELLRKVVDTGEPFVGSEVPVHYDAHGTEPQRTAYVDFIYQPMKDESGKVYAIAAQGHDVTEKVLSRRELERAKNAVDNERQNFRNLFKQTPEMVCILSGPEHVFEFVNEAHVKVLGFDATGMAVRVAQPESVEVHGILDDVYRTGVTAELNEIPVTVGNRLRHFNLTYAPRRDESGVINGIMILGTEISDIVDARKLLAIEAEKLKRAEERYRILFDRSPLPKWIIEVDTYKFIDVNDAAVSHYGYTKEEFLSMTALDIRPKEDVADFISTMAMDFSPSNLPNINMRRRHVKKDGSIIEVEMSALELMLDGRRCRIGAVVDITERVSAEQRQKELLESLKAAKEEAERANKLKSAFLANMSHEIRTPLGAMLGFSDLLKDPSLSETERSSFVDVLTRNGEQLAYIINDILDLSKVEAGHLTFEYDDLTPDAISAEVVSLLAIKAKEKDLVLEIEPDASTPKSIVSDQGRIRQILLNLVGNAIKFTQFGSVKLRCYATKLPSGRDGICYDVTDTGIGIPKLQQGRLFEMFVQGDGSMTRRFGGTGLGLALSRKLARELGGDVVIVSSVEGKGSVFRVTIEDRPERRSKQSVKRVDPDFENLAETSLEGVRVLVVDDAPDNQRLIWRYLTNRGAIVDSAENGYLGYRKAIVGNFDLVLMDIQMPEMDGYTATQKLRAAGFTKPIIALTAHAMSDVRLKCLNVGCTDHLSKPINSKELIGAVAKYTGACKH